MHELALSAVMLIDNRILALQTIVTQSPSL